MYQAVTKMISEHIYEGTASGKTVVMDTGNAEKVGQTPMELLLSAISGCSSVDVVGIIEKRRRQVLGLEVQTQAVRRDEPYPRIFTWIKLHFILTSPDAELPELERAVALSMEKYCSVAGMLNQAAKIESTCEIIRP